MIQNSNLTQHIYDNKDIGHILETKRKVALDENEAEQLLFEYRNNFCSVFYYLSEKSKVLNKKTFKNSFLKANLKNFREEELYYLFEGIYNQIKLGHNDFFYLFHYFLIHIDKNPFQNLFVNLLNEPDYKINEIIVSQDILSKIALNSSNPTIFQLQIIYFIMKNENLAVKDYLKSLNLKFTFYGVYGCKSFFRFWYGDLSEKIIEINFEP